MIGGEALVNGEEENTSGEVDRGRDEQTRDPGR